jgi:phospholipase C
VSDWELSRRDFLERTAHAAGLAGMASLPPSTLLAEAAEAAARRNRLPSPRNLELDHVVVLMMENRSFDHYFGWLSDLADGIQHQTFPDPDGNQFETRHFKSLGLSGGAEYKGCGYGDPGHGWDNGRAQLKGGFMAEDSGNDELALCYFNESELPYIHPAAKAYTLYDRWFCSLLSPTWPNRYYKWSAQSGGIKTNYPEPPLGNTWETIFDRALAKSVSARYYYSDLPFSATFGPRASAWSHSISDYYADCAAGTLPNIAFVDPAFGKEAVDGLSTDEHPLGDVRLGQAFMGDIVNAFIRSPNYRRGALFVIYDEWGGFFDHVRPPRVVDDLANRDLEEDFAQMGFRIPAVAVSPYTRGRAGGARFRVDHGVYGHESILKFISYRFGLGYLNKRHRYARNVGRSFDWESKPDFEPVALPDPPEVATTPCHAGGMDVPQGASGTAHGEDMNLLAELADWLGMPVLRPSADVLFRQPDATVRAIRRERAARRRRSQDLRASRGR